MVGKILPKSNAEPVTQNSQSAAVYLPDTNLEGIVDNYRQQLDKLDITQEKYDSEFATFRRMRAKLVQSFRAKNFEFNLDELLSVVEADFPADNAAEHDEDHMPQFNVTWMRTALATWKKDHHRHLRLAQEENPSSAARQLRQQFLRWRLARMFAGDMTNSFRAILGETLNRTLAQRDRVEEQVQYLTAGSGKNVAGGTDLLREIANEDRRLRHVGRLAVLDVSRSEFSRWRQAHPDPDSLSWWWHLDEPNISWDVVQIGWLVATLGLLLFTLWIVLDAAERISLMFLQFLNITQLSQEGLDWFEVGAIAIQLIFGGQLSLRLTEGFVQRLNLWLGEIPIFRKTRAPEFFGTTLLLFLVISLITFIVFPLMTSFLRGNTDTALEQGDFAAARTQLEFIQFTDFSEQYATNMTQLGILYERSGDTDRAAGSYSRALASEPNNLLARYRLAELYIDAGDTVAAMNLLDDAIMLLNRPQDLPLSEGDVTKLQVLLLTSRGRAFLEMGQPEVARDDFDAAETLILNQETVPGTADDLFITPSNRRNPPQGAVPTVELAYLQAQTFEQLFGKAQYEQERENYRLEALRLWGDVQNMVNPAVGEQRLWEQEAREARVRLRPERRGVPAPPSPGGERDEGQQPDVGRGGVEGGPAIPPPPQRPNASSGG